MDSPDSLQIDRNGNVAVLTFNRPAVLNALNVAALGSLDAALREIQADTAVRAVVMTGAGAKAFVAGADIRELAGLSPAGAHAQARAGQAVFDRIETLGKPVVAAINGYALGGGCELALACTFRIAAESARIGLPEINLGLIPGYGGTQRLARCVGTARALEMMLTGEPIASADAHRIGLVHRVVPDAQLMEEALALANGLAAKAPVAVRFILDAVHRGVQLPLPEGLALEAALFGVVAATGDMKEGTTAFLQKRKPAFTGR